MYDPRGFKNHKVGIAVCRDIFNTTSLADSMSGRIAHSRVDTASGDRELCTDVDVHRGESPRRPYECMALTLQHLKHKSSIKHVVLLFVPGLQPSHLNLEDRFLAPSAYMPFPTRAETSSTDTLLPIIPRLFSHACPTRAPGDTRRLHSVLQVLLNAPLSQSEKARRERAKAEMMRKMKLGTTTQQQGGPDQQKYQYDPQVFLLTPNQMLDNEYPVPSYVPGSTNAASPGNGTTNGVQETGQVRSGNASVGDEVWLPGLQAAAGVAKDVVLEGVAVAKKGLSLSDEILGRLVGSSKAASPTEVADDSASSSSSTTSKKAKASKKERDGKTEVSIEVSTTTMANLDDFSVGNGWVETPTLKVGESVEGLKYKVLAIDCEMVSCGAAVVDL